MPRIAIGFALAALAIGIAAPAVADSDVSSRGASRGANELAAQTTRPHITVRPRLTQPGPNSKRYCRSWLAQEYRVSGTVIVPQMQCWWQ